MIIAKIITAKGLVLKVRLVFSHYETLGLDRGATQQQIKSRYYELAKKYHPDIAKDAANSQKFVNIQQAYEILSDEQKRKEYDLSYSSNYKQKANYEYEHPYQTYYQQQQRQKAYSYNYNYAQDPLPSFFTLLKENMFSVLMWVLYGYMFWQVFWYLQGKMTEVDIQRQNFLIMTQPGVVERRKKLYDPEIKEKNIYGQLVDLKISGTTVKSTKSQQQQKQSIKSIKGIYKDCKYDPKNISLRQEQYM